MSQARDHQLDRLGNRADHSPDIECQRNGPQQFALCDRIYAISECSTKCGRLCILVFCCGSRSARPLRLIAALSYVAAVSCLECGQRVGHMLALMMLEDSNRKRPAKDRCSQKCWVLEKNVRPARVKRRGHEDDRDENLGYRFFSLGSRSVFIFSVRCNV